MAGSVRVVSLRKGGTPAVEGETVIDCDRSHPVLGNQHLLHDHRDMAERSRVIAASAVDVEADLVAGGPISREITSLAARAIRGEHLALRCWCAPKDCHLDLIRLKILAAAGLRLDPAPTAQLGLF